MQVPSEPCINAPDSLPDAPSNPAKPRRWTIFASALLLLALSLVVIYTTRAAFFSPLALVVVAAIGLAALLLQLRLRSNMPKQGRAPFWLNITGIACALLAVFSDLLHLSRQTALLAALAAVLCFAISSIQISKALRINTEPPPSKENGK